MSGPRVNEAMALACDPFAGDESYVRVMSDKFVVTRKEHICQHCGEDIPIGHRVRARSELNKEEGVRKTWYFCVFCCHAMATASEDDGAALDRRYQLFCSSEM